MRGSSLSAPGMVAIICDMIPLDAEGMAIELGAGTGYHTLVVAHRNKGLRIIGYEPVATLYQKARQAFVHSDCCRVKAMNDAWAEQTKIPGNVALAFQTYVNPNGFYGNLFYSLDAAGVYILPRPLTQQEFETQPADEWLRSISSTYQEYLARGYRHSCALVRLRNNNGVLLEDQRLYAVTFVPHRQERILNDDSFDNIALKFLLDEFSRSR